VSEQAGTEQGGTAGQAPVDDPTYQQQAAEAVGSIQADGAADASESVEEMAQRLASQQIRQAMSEYEQRLGDLLEASKKQFDNQSQQLQLLQQQLAATRLQAGPPMAVTLANSVQQRLATIASTNPDRGPGHWAGVVDQGNRLADAIKEAAGSDSPGTAINEAALLSHGIAQFLTRVTKQVSGKPVEGSDVLLDELERLADAVHELEPAA
jgi:hypothetical protein